MNLFKLLIIIIVVFGICANCGDLSAQDNAGENKQNILATEFNKNLDIYSYFVDFRLKNILFGTEVSLYNKYNSTVINSNNLSYRDDNAFALDLKHGLNDKIKVGLNAGFLYNNDSKSIGNHKNYDVSLVPNFAYELNQNQFLKIGVGEKYINKIGAKSSGTIYSGEFNLNEIKYDIFQIDTRLCSQYIFFDNDRTNKNTLAALKIATEPSEQDNITAELSYNDKLVDFIGITNTKSNKYLYEMNNDKVFDSNLKIDYNILKNIQLHSSIGYYSQAKNREFNKIDIEYQNSLFGRNSSLLKFFTSNTVTMIFDKLFSVFNINYETSEENFNVYANTSNYDNYQLNTMIRSQLLNDYSASKLELSTTQNLEIGQSDSLLLNLAASIYRYDTPAKDNHDEHDESFSSLYLQYNHRFTKSFILKSFLEIKNRHYVYLEGEKSAQNNAVKTIRFANGLEFKNDKLYFNPTIEVLANYHIYDYQTTAVSAYSFRQISYRDSSTIQLYPSVYSSLNSSIRYSERSILYWERFAENPIEGNMEIMFKYMLFKKIEKYFLGLGVSYYRLNREDLRQNKNLHLSHILSPETVIGIKFSNNNEVRLVGKYDFQDIGGVKRNVANITLRTTIEY